MGRAPCCEKVGLNRGPWTREEDLRLIQYIKTHGEGCWRLLPKAAGLLRCGKSCRLRWINYLRPDLKRGNITEEEDRLIIKLHALLGNRWSLIAGRLPGRTDNEIKNYWNTHLKKRLRNMGINPLTHQPLFLLGLANRAEMCHDVATTSGGDNCTSTPHISSNVHLLCRPTHQHATEVHVEGTTQTSILANVGDVAPSSLAMTTSLTKVPIYDEFTEEEEEEEDEEEEEGKRDQHSCSVLRFLASDIVWDMEMVHPIQSNASSSSSSSTDLWAHSSFLDPPPTPSPHQ